MQKKWYRLDTAALIFPAITRRDWCNAFRVSASLSEPVDPEILQRATDDLRRRFPSYFVTLRKGFFWYYLEESSRPVTVQGDYAYPLTFMSSRELRRNCLRVLWYKNRIAVEFSTPSPTGVAAASFWPIWWPTIWSCATGSRFPGRD